MQGILGLLSIFRNEGQQRFLTWTVFTPPYHEIINHYNLPQNEFEIDEKANCLPNPG